MTPGAGARKALRLRRSEGVPRGTVMGVREPVGVP